MHEKVYIKLREQINFIQWRSEGGGRMGRSPRAAHVKKAAH